MKGTLLVLLAGCGACQDQPRSSCAELSQYAPAGVTLGSNETECARVLAFADTVDEHYGMNFRTWLSQVLPERAHLINDAVFALGGTSPWTPQSFGPVPAHVPCGRGVPLTDSDWFASPLSQVLASRPAEMYVSIAIEIPPAPGDMAAIRVYQDFDCDQTVGVTELVGEFHHGLPVLAGGWRLVSTTLAPIDE